MLFHVNDAILPRREDAVAFFCKEATPWTLKN
jgi:hypothetical protein